MGGSTELQFGSKQQFGSKDMANLVDWSSVVDFFGMGKCAGKASLSTPYHLYCLVPVNRQEYHIYIYNPNNQTETQTESNHVPLFLQNPNGGFLKWWYPTTIGFPAKNDHFEVFWGYHHLRKHPTNPVDVSKFSKCHTAPGDAYVPQVGAPTVTGI